MAKKLFTVNVHYDYYASVQVEAETESEALELAKEKADQLPIEQMQYCDFTDACIAG